MAFGLVIWDVEEFGVAGLYIFFLFSVLGVWMNLDWDY